ncbi:acetolactate synthase [Mycolicibacterium madagascariense]|uniref:Acetolactate synthase n=1 Tax=Mycolicibacterium madagascariense TaxID=212765 RepID=A0A7I7XF25_9MYCO|nr:acetolactate synthase large subunit [Mycolicibacterium madagascariense]MCV7011267.1 acetolactate synthase large subunit [Mycolicibacterium madagascariense]BBZ27792.1 acetolactate synthase [Mycolicibacterium madagascariense]
MSAPTTRPPEQDRRANGSPAVGRTAAAQPRVVAPERMTGAKAVIRSLEELDVDTIFGIPGGAVLPVYDPLFDSQKLRHVLVRHEQGAGHAASGYAHATGKVGVMMATSGPGATNLVTPLADAQMDSIPVVAITGQVGRALIGTDAFQEADISGITMPITKHNFLVRHGDEIAQVMAEAFYIARSGRPGAVLVDVPKDVLQAECTFSWPPTMDLPGYKPNTKPHSKQIREAARLIAAASKPVLYVGGGVIRGEASEQLLELAELTGIPVVTTLMARGAFPDSHSQNLGMPGMHGTVAAVGALQKSDLLIALGTRFDDRVTGKLDSFAPDAKVIHADIDPAEIGKNRNADVPIVGDVKNVLTELIGALRRDGIGGQERSDRGIGTDAATLDLDEWWEYLRGVQATFPLSYGPQSDGSMSPEYVIETLGRIAGPDAVYVAGVGQHQMWAAQFISYEKPKTWLNSGGLGTMGYAVPAAMGAKFGKPEAEVWAIDGDGCFQMTNQELATCAVEGAPIKVALINNGNLGMVRQWQTLFYEERYSQTNLSTHSHRIPDFVKLAEALGCVGLRCERPEDVEDVINQARAINDRPVVIDFIVGADAQVWPMVAAGMGNDEIQAARGIRPLFDDQGNEGHA